MASKEAQSKKTVKKTFFEFTAPLTSTPIHLYGSSAEEFIGRTVKIDLTKNLRGKNLELKLRLKVNDGKLLGIPESLELGIAYIRRVMRKGTDYVEDSFVAECRDVSVRVKPFLLTRKRVSREILKRLREETKKNLESHLKTRNAEEIFSEIITNKLQKQLSIKLKKIYPLALCEIRVFERVNKK